MPGEERKLVTVLFADLVQSTALFAGRDAEQVRAMLGAFFEEMTRGVQAFGGTVEKYAGDAIMAVFGVPRVHEDDAERAVRAAVAMRESLTQLNPVFEQKYGVRLELLVDIAPGEVAAAGEPATEFLVTGEVSTLAARLQAVATGIVLSADTYRLVGPLVDVERLDGLALNGFDGPITGYRVKAFRTEEGRPHGIPGLSSPMVGRDRELRVLEGGIDALRQGRGQIASIVGEAGIGKSRLKLAPGLNPASMMGRAGAVATHSDRPPSARTSWRTSRRLKPRPHTARSRRKIVTRYAAATRPEERTRACQASTTTVPPSISRSSARDSPSSPSHPRACGRPSTSGTVSRFRWPRRQGGEPVSLSLAELSHALPVQHARPGTPNRRYG